MKYPSPRLLGSLRALFPILGVPAILMICLVSVATAITPTTGKIFDDTQYFDQYAFDHVDQGTAAQITVSVATQVTNFSLLTFPFATGAVPHGIPGPTPNPQSMKFLIYDVNASAFIYNSGPVSYPDASNSGDPVSTKMSPTFPAITLQPGDTYYFGAVFDSFTGVGFGASNNPDTPPGPTPSTYTQGNISAPAVNNNFTNYTTPALGGPGTAIICLELFNLTTETWTGATSSDWNDNTNWNPATVPDANTRVTIPNVTNQPHIISADVTVASLDLQAGSTLTIDSGRTLTVNLGDTILSGSLAGSGYTLSFKDLFINNAAGISLGGPTSLSEAVTFLNGKLDTGANSLSLGLGVASHYTSTLGSIAGAVINWSATRYIIGSFTKTLLNQGSSKGLQAEFFEVGTANGFSPVDLKNIPGTGPESSSSVDFTVKPTQGPQPNVDPTTSIQRYWTLTASGPITADLTFHYLAGDVMGNEANYRVIRVVGSTSVSFPTSTVDTTAHTATLTGVSNFSDWTVGENSFPTAAPANLSGVVTDSNGVPLGGVVMNLSGARSARTITDSHGSYRFADLNAGGFYSVAPSRANFHFGPAERSFSLQADKTDAAFTAIPDATITANPLDTNLYFVRQQYLDFLNREPDASGLEYWTSQIDNCNGDLVCLRSKRVGVAAAFFIEQEFQQTGSYVYRLYSGGLGRQVNYAEFSADRQQVIGGGDLQAAQAAFTGIFVQRPEFIQKYQSATSADSFVDAVIRNVQEASGTDLSSSRDALIAKYNASSNTAASRSLTLAQAVEDASFKQAEYNKSFVLMQYFGYLKRDPDQAGLDFWLNVLDIRTPNNFHGMVCSFITSTEYQNRFSSVVTHNNGECGQ